MHDFGTSNVVQLAFVLADAFGVDFSSVSNYASVILEKRVCVSVLVCCCLSGVSIAIDCSRCLLFLP